MTKPPPDWPHGALPLYLNKKCSAFHLGMSLAQFEREIAEGRLPAERIRGNKKVWHRHELERMAAGSDGRVEGAAFTENPPDKELGIGESTST